MACLPNPGVDSLGHLRQRGEGCVGVGAHVLLSGHGGDTLFRWHPEQKLQYVLPADVAR